MAPAQWAAGTTRLKWLEERLPEYIKIVREGKNISEWFAAQFIAWHKKYHWSVGINVEPKEGEVYAEPATPEEETIKSAARSSIESKVRTWFRYNYKKSINPKADLDAKVLPPVDLTTIAVSAPTAAQFKKPKLPPKPKTPIEFQVYLKMFNKDRIEPALELERAKNMNLENGQEINLRNRIAQQLFASEDAETKELVRQECERQHSEAIKKWSLAIEEATSPKQLEAAIQNMVPHVESFLRQLCYRTGLSATLIIGGPRPSWAGEIFVDFFHHGETTENDAVDFGVFGNKLLNGELFETFMKFLNKVYPLESRVARFGGKSGTAPSDTEVREVPSKTILRNGGGGASPSNSSPRTSNTASSTGVSAHLSSKATTAAASASTTSPQSVAGDSWSPLMPLPSVAGPPGRTADDSQRHKATESNCGTTECATEGVSDDFVTIDYEVQRLRNIAQNNAIMESLGLKDFDLVSDTSSQASTTVKTRTSVRKRKNSDRSITEPVRKSQRLVRDIPTPNSVVDNVPAVVDNVQTVVNNVPTVVDNVPTVVDNVPTVVDNVPTVVDNVPTVVDNVPTVVDNAPSTVNNTPTTVNNAPTTVGNAPTTTNNVSATVDNALTTVDNAPTTENRPRSTRCKAASDVSELPEVTTSVSPKTTAPATNKKDPPLKSGASKSGGPASMLALRERKKWPQWFEKQFDSLSEISQAEHWLDLVRLWAELERKKGYASESSSLLPVADRPKEVRQWIARRRAVTYFPTLDLDDFKSLWWKWWHACQPKWRSVDSTGTLIRKINGDWDKLNVGGLNGLLLHCRALAWWIKAAPPEQEGEWEKAVEEVTWVFRCCLKLSQK